MPENFTATKEALLKLLDELIAEKSAEWWTRFYSDPNRKCPFFTVNADENLFELVEKGEFRAPAKVLDIGCGNGRNSIYLAKHGFDVEAVDFSETAIELAKENAAKANVSVKFHCRSIFDFEYAAKSFDAIYDSGCFHHIAPHRRPDFLALVANALKTGGIFAMVCFAPGGGSDFSDLEVYQNQTTGGGLSFTEESLRKIFSNDFQNIEIRKMKEFSETENLFGKDFLWTVKMGRK